MHSFQIIIVVWKASYELQIVSAFPEKFYEVKQIICKNMLYFQKKSSDQVP